MLQSHGGHYWTPQRELHLSFCETAWVFLSVTHVWLSQFQEYAGEGLRTLALAYKDLDEDKFAEWRRRHHEASIAMEDREEKLDAIYEEIEKDLMVKSTPHLLQYY